MYKYKRAAILGVDGAGNFFRQTDTPCMDDLFRDGAVTYDALTSIPTISAECWGSMLIGVGPETHGLTNEIVSTKAYDVESKYPSIFRVLRDARPQAEMFSVCGWNPINTGIIEENVGVTKLAAENDAGVCEKILGCLDGGGDPVLLFAQFDDVDGAGHKFGYGNKLYLKKITEIDALIGKIVAKYREKGLLEDTLFIISADHGGNRLHGHGGKSDREKLIFIGCAGKSVKKGVIRDMHVRDIAAVTAYALGIDAPDTWTAKVPKGIFDET
ncbi:MAG: alkaline phosphatase family protein [Oscillospiraceae bacterium]|nr:alkaline phosphatase family protein [Oscillospiraceae bacterium]